MFLGVLSPLSVLTVNASFKNLDFDNLPEDLRFYEHPKENGDSNEKGKEEGMEGELVNLSDIPPSPSLSLPNSPSPVHSPSLSIPSSFPSPSPLPGFLKFPGTDKPEQHYENELKEDLENKAEQIKSLSMELEVFKRTLEIKDEDMLKIKKEMEAKSKEVHSLYQILQEWENERQNGNDQKRNHMFTPNHCTISYKVTNF